MAIRTGMCRSFKLELLGAIHDFGADIFRCALYTPAATIDPDTLVAYSSVDEVVASGYSPGGAIAMVASGYPAIDQGSGQAWVRFGDVSFGARLTFSARGCVFYNASKANRAIVAVDFGAVRAPVDGPFSVLFPPANPPLVILA